MNNELEASNLDSINIDAQAKLKKAKQKKSLIRIVKFIIFSISAGAIQLITFTILNEKAKMQYWGAYLIALTLSVLYNFTINRKFTFKSANNVPLAMFLVAIFYAIFTPLSTIAGNALQTHHRANEYLILGVTMLSNLLLEFLYLRFIVYKNSINTNKHGQKEKEQLDKITDKTMV